MSLTDNRIRANAQKLASAAEHSDTRSVSRGPQSASDQAKLGLQKYGIYGVVMGVLLSRATSFDSGGFKRDSAVHLPYPRQFQLPVELPCTEGDGVDRVGRRNCPSGHYY